MDLFPAVEGVLAADIRKLPFPDNSVETIRAIDVLEHIPRADTLPCLQHWAKLLKKGGAVEVRCPDIRKQCELLLDGTWSPEIWSHMVYAAQDSPGNFHMAGFTSESLSHLVSQAGLHVVEVKPEHELVPCAGNANLRLLATKP